ncbi:MAG: hypothetical protein LBQ52_06370 [Helicobacteraceae bacterium]|nr:hypothetical protein [Helicobacteraceae bacterium]
MTLAALFRWCGAAIVLIVFYYLVIKPFIKKALEIKIEEPTDKKSRIAFSQEELELPNNNKEIYKKIERSLKLSEADRLKEIKYEVLRDKLREITAEKPTESSATIEKLLKDR